MNLHCPHCGVKGSADDSYSGRRVKCPKCDTIFKLTPDPAIELAGDASPALSTSSISLHCPECGVSGTADASYNGQSVRCPQCTAIFTAGSVLTAEHAVETVTGIADAPDESVLPAGATEVVDEPVMTAEAAVDAVEGISGESTEQVAMVEEGVVLDAVEPVSDIEESPADVYETVDMEELEPAPTVEEIGIIAGDEDLLLETADFVEEVAAAEEDEEGVGTELEEVVLLAEGEELDEPQAAPPAQESVDVSAAPVEQTPYGVDTEECWQCGKTDSSGQPFTTKDGRMYCSDCVPVEEAAEVEPPAEEPAAAAAFTGRETGPQDVAGESRADVPYYNFTIGEALREAWNHTRGAKGTIWKGSVLMYLAIMVVVAVGAFLLPSETTGTPEVTSMIGGAIFQAAGDAVSVLFTAGLLFMGIRRVAGDPIEWRMVFNGFSCAGKIIIATILQSILISVGILLLVLPGIYLAVGYAMALPLIVDRGMSPWEAMETSRKAIHKIWWKAAGLLLVMGLITIVSMIPLGIGLIWTWPMFIVLAGVIYRYLFGTGKSGE